MRATDVEAIQALSKCVEHVRATIGHDEAVDNFAELDELVLQAQETLNTCMRETGLALRLALEQQPAITSVLRLFTEAEVALTGIVPRTKLHEPDAMPQIARLRLLADVLTIVETGRIVMETRLQLNGRSAANATLYDGLAATLSIELAAKSALVELAPSLLYDS